MPSYFEYIDQGKRTIIDDNTPRYIKSRSVIAGTLSYSLDDSTSHSLTSRQEENLMKLIPDSVRINALCVMTLPLLEGESLIAIQTDVKDEYIGYSVRYPVSGTNIAYIYIYVGRGANVKDINTIRAHLTINLYTRAINVNGNVGLQIFNSNGNIIFNSNSNIMSVRYFYNNPDVIGNKVGNGVYFHNNISVWSEIPNVGIIYRNSETDSVCINNLPGGIIFGGEYSGGGATFCLSGYITFTLSGIGIMFGIGQVNMIYTRYEFAVWTHWIEGDEMPEWTKTYNAQFGKSLCVSIIR